MISPKALKIGAKEIAPSLTRMFNACIDKGTWPSNWKKAEWSPIFKKGDPLYDENYRPITIQPIFNKVFEEILNKQLYHAINDTLSEHLTAYRKRNSCETALIKLTEHWRTALDSRQLIGLLSTDMSKAFDLLHHPLLLAKLKSYGLDIHSLELMHSYFNGRYNRVKLGNDTTSSWKPTC